MKSYSEITNKYMLANKKRTILTLVGVILAVALISAIGLFFVGMREASINYVKTTQGSFHILFVDPSEEFMEMVESHKKVAKSGVLYQTDAFDLNDRIKLQWIFGTGEGLDLIPYKITEGKMPKVANEVALEKWLLPYFGENTTIGSEITIQDSSYVITGLLSSSPESQAVKIANVLTIERERASYKPIFVVEFKEGENIAALAKQFETLGKDYECNINHLLISMLAYDNEGMVGLYWVIGIVILVVIISTIAVIYNAFHIGVVWRIKQFGLLRAIGATGKQIRKIVLKEALILCFIGIPLGLLFGIVAIYCINFVFKLVGPDYIQIMTPVIDGRILLFAGILGFITLMISAILPAKTAGKISPLVAISNLFSFKKEKFKRKRRGIIKFFRIEFRMAFMNMKRNPTRHRVTVFSIGLSVFLFIFFRYFTDTAMIIQPPKGEASNVHFALNYSTKDMNNIEALSEEELDTLWESGLFSNIYTIYQPLDVTIELHSEQISKEIEAMGEYYTKDGNTVTTPGRLLVYDEVALQKSEKYITSGSINNDIDEVFYVTNSEFFNPNSNKTYVGPVGEFGVGDSVKLKNLQGKTIDATVQVVGFTDYPPFQNGIADNRGIFITSKETAEKLLQEEVKAIGINLSLKNTDDEKKAADLLNVMITNHPEMATINYIENHKNVGSIMILIQFLLYGFVVVISLIGSVNIVNTLTTNLILREKEFSTVKAIGMTQKILRRMVVSEGLLYGIKGTFFGSLVGIIMTKLLQVSFSMQTEIPYRIPFSSMAIAGVAALLITYLSVLQPLRKLNQQNLIETIREDY